MERDHSEAERAQHIKQIHDLQEHIQEKDRQLIELQEQVGSLFIYIIICSFTIFLVDLAYNELMVILYFSIGLLRRPLCLKMSSSEKPKHG